jgi:hypothetical protein
MIFCLTAVGTAGGIEKIGKLEEVVDIVAWPGYIERGDTGSGLRLGHRIRKKI